MLLMGLDNLHRPILRESTLYTGMIADETGRQVPGAILKSFMELRKRVGTLPKRKKEKVRFLIRSAEDLVDKVRDAANELGLIIMAGEGSTGALIPVFGEDGATAEGSLATVSMRVVIIDISDGSCLECWGFGLGADQQDKAGGKAMTYAFKAALIIALLCGGSDNAKALGVVDTDDDGEPIPGMKRIAGNKPRMEGSTALSLDVVTKLVVEAKTRTEFDTALALARKLRPEQQLSLKDDLVEAKRRTEVVSGK